MKRKIIILVAVIIMVLLLCSCGKVDINCTVTEDNLAEMNMRLEVPLENLSDKDKEFMRTTIYNVYSHWFDMGLDVEESIYTDPIVLTGSFKKQTNSQEEAYDALVSFMSDKLSPFAEVEGGYSPSFFNDKGYLKAKLDLRNIVAMDTLEALPPSQRQSIVDHIDNVKGRVTFTLPGEVIDSVGEVEKGAVYKEIDFDEEITLMVTTEYKHSENINEYDELKEQTAQEKKKLLTLSIVVGVLVLVTIFSIILLYCTVKA